MPYILGLGVVVALVLTVSPQEIGSAARRFDPVYAPLVAGLSLAYYLEQGIRWRPLLRAIGITLPFPEIMVLNLAGQSVGLLPGGELARAVMVSEASGCEVGEVAATVTVQEVIYTVFIVAAAVPGALNNRLAAFGVVIALAGVVAVVLVLTVESVFAFVIAQVKRIPLARRWVPDAELLQRDAVRLLRRWDTLWWSAVSAAQAVGTISMFWLIVQAVDPGAISWPQAAFVYAVAHLAGAISLSPGGLGGFEAACTGMLVANGVPFGIAVAAGLLQRVADKGLGSLYGGLAYLVARDHYDLKNRHMVKHGGSG